MSRCLLLLLLLFSSCATRFNKTKEYKEAEAKCVINPNYWERNDPAACEFLIRNLDESKKEASLFSAILKGSNCEKKLTVMIKSSKDQSITDPEYSKIQEQTVLSCYEFFSSINKDDFNKSDYYWIAKGLLNPSNTFCGISIKYIQTELKKNKNFKSSSPVCYKHISTLLDIAMNSYSPESESTESFTKSTNLSTFLCNLNDLEACKLKENILSIKKIRSNAEAEKYARIRADLEREKTAEVDRNRIESEKANAEKEFTRQRSLCKQGDINICWDLFVANKENSHGYEYLRDACLLGHSKACSAKQIIDQENAQAELIRQKELTEKAKRNEEFSNSLKCMRTAIIGVGAGHVICNEACPDYEQCLENEKERMRKNRSIKCTTTGTYGNRQTECREY